MAKITLTIEADGPGDLHRSLADLCDRLEGNDPDEIGKPLSEELRETYWPHDPAPVEGLIGPAEDIAPPGPQYLGPPREHQNQHLQNGGGEEGRRRRRTKAELEADPAWRAKNGLPPLPNTAQSALLTSAGSSSAAPVPSTPPAAAPSPAPGKALFGIGAGQAQPQAQAQPAPPADSPEAAFKAAFRQSMSTRGAKATQEILIKLAGVRMTAEVKPEQYQALTAAFLAA